MVIFWKISNVCVHFTQVVLIIWSECMYVWCEDLALAECALGAVFDPGGPAEAHDAVFILASLGDVIADALSQARVRDTAWAAFALGHHGEVAMRRRAQQRPAVHLSLLHPTHNTPLSKAQLLSQHHRLLPLSYLLYG